MQDTDNRGTTPPPPHAANLELVPQRPSAPAVYVAGGETPPRYLHRATLHDAKFVNHLQKKFGHSLGFLPFAAIEFHLQAGNVTLCTENDDSAGYLLVRPILAWQPQLASIVQAAVCMDAQRRHHGLAMLLQIEHEARARGQFGIQACCAIGVEANEFWQAAGFKPICHMTPDTKSKREVICWRKPLTRSLPAWFTDLPAKAGHRCRPVQSIRNATRPKKTADFAQRFLAARLVPQGNPELPNSGVILSTSAEAQQILHGGTNALHAHQHTPEKI